MLISLDLAIPEIDYHQPCHSFVANFARFLGVHFSQTTRTVINTSGIPTNMSPDATNMKANAPISSMLYGLIVGASDLPTTIEDYTLDALILHGLTPALLRYGQCDIGPVIVAGYEATINIVRQFTGNTNSTATIREVGLRTTQTAGYVDIIREVIPDVPMPAGTPRTFTLTLKVTAGP